MFDTAILKIAGRCNINCTYCYVYNLADRSSRSLPSRAADVVLSAFFLRLTKYLIDRRKQVFHIVLHGGEPLLAGKDTLRKFVALRTEAELASGTDISTSLQTNGLLLSDDWIDFFGSNGIRIGISIDGPEAIHDEFRLTKNGRGTHARVEQVVKELVQNPVWSSVFSGALSVLSPKADGASLVRYFYDLGVKNVNFLLPDQNHDARYNTDDEIDALGKILVDAYVEWRLIDDPSFKIGLFSDILRYYLSGQRSLSDTLSGNPISIITVETTGALEPLDVFKCCGRDITRTEFNVFSHDFGELVDRYPFSLQLNPTAHLAKVCQNCQYLEICGGGYLPHRLDRGRFDNPTVFCSAMKALFAVVQGDAQAHGAQR